MKKTAGFLVVLLAAFALAFSSPNNASKKITVVIDAGHGGSDHGATIDSFKEKEIVAQITDKIKLQNSDKDVEIILTRADDSTINFEQRTKMINDLKPDLVISLHVNMIKNVSARGMEFYISKNNIGYEKSNLHAKKLEEKFEKNGMTSRGIKEAQYVMLKKSEAPAILIELGFLSNLNDRKYLTEDNGQNRIAETILEFLSEIE